MFTGATAEIRGTSLRKRGGFRGLSCGFDGLADGPIGLSGLGDYLPNPVQINSKWFAFAAPVVQPDGWYVMSFQAMEDYARAHGGQTEDDLFVVGGNNPFTTPGPGASATRPSFDYVRAGDVVRVALTISWTNLSPATPSTLLQKMAQGINGLGIMTYVDGAVGWFGSGFTVDVLSKIDRNSFNDIASDVAGVASNILSLSGPGTAAFVSQVEQTGGKVKVNAPPDNSKNPFGLSSSNLLLIGGAGVLLLVVLVKK